MKVSTEWRGHAHDLRRIAEMLVKRPTVEFDEHVTKLQEIASEIEAEAAEYEDLYERDRQST